MGYFSLFFIYKVPGRSLWAGGCGTPPGTGSAGGLLPACQPRLLLKVITILTIVMVRRKALWLCPGQPGPVLNGAGDCAAPTLGVGQWVWDLPPGTTGALIPRGGTGCSTDPAAVGGRLQMWSCTSGERILARAGREPGSVGGAGSHWSIHPAPEHPSCPPASRYRTSSIRPALERPPIPPCPWLPPLSPRGCLGVFLRPNPELWITPGSPQGPSLALGAAPSHASAGPGQGQPPTLGTPCWGVSPCPRRG